MAAKSRVTSTQPAVASRHQAQLDDADLRASIAPGLCIGMFVLTLALFPGCAAADEKTAYLQATGSTPAQSTPEAHTAPAQSTPEVHAVPAEVKAEVRTVPAQSTPEAQTAVVQGPHRAEFGHERASREARRIADWIVDSADNKGLPFVILDKVDARLFVFNADGRIRGAAAALLGSARGDDSVPGIGDREFADMTPDTRTTPAGRFVSSIGQDTHGQDVVWVDYDAAVAIHRVITTKPAERRLQRLATPTPLDNRISYGCINVPKRFYEKVVAPAFAGTYGIVYVLPETRPAREVFRSYDVDERPDRTRSANAQH